MGRRRAVVLFNLGGPDSPEAVEPFLRNLFSDRMIIGAPWPVRPLLARRIARKRAPVAREIYAHLGGRSPLVEITREQGRALEEALDGDGTEVKTFLAMRYWHPMTAGAVKAVADWGAEDVTLLPLYPQYARATTGSSLAAWHRVARRAGLRVPTRPICCYPTMDGFVTAYAELTSAAVVRAAAAGPPRVLFSAHGLPRREIRRGDPYQWQVERSADAIAERARLEDWVVCYQSRVGPLDWIGPSTEAEIERAGRDGVPAVVVPVAFVSEHSETLVELDIEYAGLAERSGVPAYERVPTAGTRAAFIAGLAGLVRQAWTAPAGSLRSQDGGRLCPGACTRCPQEDR